MNLGRHGTRERFSSNVTYDKYTWVCTNTHTLEQITEHTIL